VKFLEEKATRNWLKQIKVEANEDAKRIRGISNLNQEVGRGQTAERTLLWLEWPAIHNMTVLR
jgi:hypothetical protein